MPLQDFLNTFDFDMLDADIRIGRPRKRHQQNFLEQFLFVARADIRTAKKPLYILEI